MGAPDREVGRRRVVDALTAVAAGLALGASFVDFRLWMIPWVAVAPLIAFADSHAPRRAFRLGWLAGIAGIGCAFAWLIYAFQVFGGFGLAIAGAIFVVPVVWMGLQIGLFTGLLAVVPPLPLALAAPLTFTAVEFVFPTLFPWRLAHTQLRLVPLLQSGEITGPYLLGFVIVWVNAGLVRVIRDRRPLPLLAALGALLLLATFGARRVATIEAVRRDAPLVRVGVVQGNIGVERKGDRAFFHRNLEDYRRLSQEIAARVDLLVWPETVVQRPFDKNLRVPGADDHPFPNPPRPLVFGGLASGSGVEGRQLFNSAFLLDRDGAIVGRYDKRVLVPFGEYLPLADRFPSLRKLSPATGHFTPGAEPTLLHVGDAQRVGPLICYEDVIPGPARAAVIGGATLLLNLTNDAWYGASAEPYQHQALALWRAVETRRDFIRSTNTGLTAAISATGAVLGELPIFVPDTLVVEARLLEGTTFYARWGDVFAWSIVAIWVTVVASGRRTRA